MPQNLDVFEYLYILVLKISVYPHVYMYVYIHIWLYIHVLYISSTHEIIRLSNALHCVGQFDIICNHIGSEKVLDSLKWSMSKQWEAAAVRVMTGPKSTLGVNNGQGRS